MLAPQEIESTLKAVHLASRVEQRRAAIALLPDSARAVGYGLLGLCHDGSVAPEDERRIVPSPWNIAQQAAEEVVTLSNHDRLALFHAFFPEIASEVEAAWHLHDRLPMLAGVSTIAFRAPNRREWQADRRAGFVCGLLQITGHYKQDIVWWARWAAHLQPLFWRSPVSVLCAAAIDQGGLVGAEVLNVLIQIVDGTDPVGMIGPDVIGSLLTCARPEAWAKIEQLLLAAQRQEGLPWRILLPCAASYG